MNKEISTKIGGKNDDLRKNRTVRGWDPFGSAGFKLLSSKDAKKEGVGGECIKKT